MNDLTIHLNQLGYRPGDRKLAFFSVPAESGTRPIPFEVLLMQGPPGKITLPVVLTGTTTAFHLDAATGFLVARLDMTDIEDPGMYRIRTETGFLSYPFMIGDRVYDDARDALLKALYFMRCGCGLDEKHAGIWKHGPCHTGEAALHHDREVKLDVSGGWHDAGDYGRYSGPGANAVADLLLAYQCFPKAFAGTLNIPESGNGVPDILNECRYELAFLMKMQDEVSGGVYHKVATLQFPGYVMPEDDLDPQCINEISSTATGDFAACLAASSVMVRPFDAGFADCALAAARHAWDWLEAHPVYPGFKNPPDVGSGEYGDHLGDTDERFWAAVELYRATGEERFHEKVKELSALEDLDRASLGWASVGGFGTVSYLMLPENQQDPDTKARLESLFLAEAQNLLAVCETDGFGISLKQTDYIWGSNMVLLNHAIHLLIANRIHPDKQLTDAAAQHFHYLFGANALGQSYVTGFGSKSLLNPHYRPSVADGIAYPIPGLVSGGPNSGRQDPAARGGLPGKTAPALSFIDDIESYATNEVTIYWNAPAVFVAAFMTQAEEDQ